MKLVYINGSERTFIENTDFLKFLVSSGKLSKDANLFDEEKQTYVAVAQILENEGTSHAGYNMYQPYYNNTPFQAAPSAFSPFSAQVNDYDRLKRKVKTLSVIVIINVVFTLLLIAVIIAAIINEGFEF